MELGKNLALWWRKKQSACGERLSWLSLSEVRFSVMWFNLVTVRSPATVPSSRLFLSYRLPPPVTVVTHLPHGLPWLWAHLTLLYPLNCFPGCTSECAFGAQGNMGWFIMVQYSISFYNNLFISLEMAIASYRPIFVIRTFWFNWAPRRVKLL